MDSGKFVFNMKKYAILIGNSQFPDETDKSKLPNLACPEKDVDGLSTVLASERGEFDVLSLKNQPSYQILRELQRKVKQADSDDLLLLYYSGHGIRSPKGAMLHLTTLDTVIAELETSAIPINRVYDILGTGKAKKIVILLDCCYSGAAGQGFKGAVDDQLQQLNNARGTYLVTASTELQVAHESAAEGLSLFTKHLIAGLETGEADKDGDGWVSMNELYDYVQGKVVAENPAQQPTKHVKEERGGLFIAKGREKRKELDEKIRNKLLDLSREDDEFIEILTESMKLAKLEIKQFSTLQQQQYQLLEKLIDEKIKPVSFVRNWDKLKHSILPASPELETSSIEEPQPIKFVEQLQINLEKQPPKISIQETTKQDIEQEKLISEEEAKEKAAQARFEQKRLEQEKSFQIWKDWREKEANKKSLQEIIEREKATQEQLVQNKLDNEKLNPERLAQRKKVKIYIAWILLSIVAALPYFLYLSQKTEQSIAPAADTALPCPDGVTPDSAAYAAIPCADADVPAPASTTDGMK